MCLLKALLVLALLGLTSCAKTYSESPSAFHYTAKQQIAVVSFQTDGFSSPSGAEIADQVVIELLKKDPKPSIVDPLVVERALAVEGDVLFDAPSYDALRKVAQLFVSGTVRSTLQTVNRGDSVRQAYITATVRVTDLSDMSVVWSERITATAEYRVRAYTYVTDSDLLEEAIERLAQKIADSFLP